MLIAAFSSFVRAEVKENVREGEESTPGLMEMVEEHGADRTAVTREN